MTAAIGVPHARLTKGMDDWKSACLVASTELNEFLAGHWAGVAQVFRLTRTVYEKGTMRREVVYGITSLPPTRASAIRLLATGASPLED